MSSPLILDACSSFRAMWIDKTNPNTIYMDVRTQKQLEQDWKQDETTNFIYKLDITCSYEALPFQNNTFTHIVWDPPHLKSLGETSIFRRKYGVLQADNWRHSIRTAFKELWRVLKPYGTLVLKWNTYEIKLSELLCLFSVQPLYGQISRSKKVSDTFWLCFVKTEASV